MLHTPEQIKQAIKDLPELSIDQLTHNYKCALGKQTASERKLYKPFIQAIEKELNKRSKPVKPTQENQMTFEELKPLIDSHIHLADMNDFKFHMCSVSNNSIFAHYNRDCGNCPFTDDTIENCCLHKSTTLSPQVEAYLTATYPELFI